MPLCTCYFGSGLHLSKKEGINQDRLCYLQKGTKITAMMLMIEIRAISDFAKGATFTPILYISMRGASCHLTRTRLFDSLNHSPASYAPSSDVSTLFTRMQRLFSHDGSNRLSQSINANSDLILPASKKELSPLLTRTTPQTWALHSGSFRLPGRRSRRKTERGCRGRAFCFAPATLPLSSLLRVELHPKAVSGARQWWIGSF